jgi:hypothetical protein
MFRYAGCLRLLGAALACATLVFGPAGCGGGGGSSTPPPGGGSGAGNPESARLLAEFVAQDANNQFVRVWDPAHPDVAIQNVRITERSGIVWTSSHLVFSDATQYDAATRTLTTLGHARVFYDNDGKLYSIDLRGGQSHVPVQLSNATDVFTTVNVFPVDAAGDDAWVDVQGGTHDWAIRSTMAATDAPVSVLRIAAAMRDAATGLPRYFFVSLGGQAGTAVQPTTFEVVDTAFAPQSVPAVAAMGNYDLWLGADPVQAGLGYLKIANKMHALRWSAGTVSVDAADLHDFTLPFGGAPSVADAQSLYFNDDTNLLAVANGSVRAVGTFSRTPSGLLDAGSYVAAIEAVTVTISQTTNQVETLRKTDGMRTLVEGDSASLQLLGASAQSLILAGTPESGQAFVLASGDNQVRTTVGSQFVGLVRAPGGPLDQPAPPVALLSCTAGTVGFCATGPLTETDLSSSSATTLGTIPAAAAWMRGDATLGVATALAGQTFLLAPGGFGANETDVRDAWQFTPGTAGSLLRATASLP